MAKRLYLLVNEDINEVLYASEDRDFIRELMCDEFMADLMYEWYWHLIAIRYQGEEDLPQIAQMTWENMMEWYDDNIRIKVIEVI